jgi:hypothetical protein
MGLHINKNEEFGLPQKGGKKECGEAEKNRA